MVVAGPFATRPKSIFFERPGHSETSLGSMSEGAWCAERSSHSQNLILMVTLALRAYHDKNKAWPEQLSALVPAYLNHIPMDPFALKGSLRYRLMGSGYLLYSVGPDGIDDGGKAIVRPIDSNTESVKSDNIERLVMLGSCGDVVAGVNRE